MRGAAGRAALRGAGLRGHARRERRGEQGGRRSSAASREQGEGVGAWREGTGRGLVRFGKKDVDAVIYGVELDAVICGAEIFFFATQAATQTLRWARPGTSAP